MLKEMEKRGENEANMAKLEKMEGEVSEKSSFWHVTAKKLHHILSLGGGGGLTMMKNRRVKFKLNNFCFF